MKKGKVHTRLHPSVQDIEEDPFAAFRPPVLPFQLPVNQRLPVPCITNLSLSSAPPYSCSFSVAITGVRSRVDLYLYSGKQKLDLWSQVIPGTYRFSTVLPHPSTATLTVFYRAGNYRSPGVTLHPIP